MCKTIDLYDTMICLTIEGINFEISDDTNIIAYKDHEDYSEKLENIVQTGKGKIKLIDLPFYSIITLLTDIKDEAGFIDDDGDKLLIEKSSIEKSSIEKSSIGKHIPNSLFYENMKNLVKDKLKDIQIDSFGENHKHFLEFCKSYDITFSALHIGIKRPTGVNLTLVRGTNLIIQDAVEDASGYQYLIEEIVLSIEKNNYTKIGIFCRAGHHRSVAIVELLKKHIYPKAKINHLHICK